MARRRRRTGDSSLELLLDTICNTFGGIVFIAMLVTVLLTQTRKRSDASTTPHDPSPAVSPADLVRLERELMEAEAALAQLGDVEDALNAIMSQADPDQREQVEAMLEAEQDAVQASVEKAHSVAELVAAQAARARAAGKAAAAERDAEKRSARSSEAIRRLSAAMAHRRAILDAADILAQKAEIASTVHTKGKAPRMRDTDKREYAIMVKYGRMYLMKKSVNGEFVTNTDDFVVDNEGSHYSAKPMPHKGVPISSGSRLKTDVQSVLSGISPQIWYLAVVVHPDSFAAFIDLKAALVEMGYEYRLMPTSGPVLDRGGDGGPVQ